MATRTSKNKPKPLKITTVRYARLFNTGNYENERVEVEALVEDHDPTTALEGLKIWVTAHARPQGCNGRKFQAATPKERAAEYLEELRCYVDDEACLPEDTETTVDQLLESIERLLRLGED